MNSGQVVNHLDYKQSLELDLHTMPYSILYSKQIKWKWHVINDIGQY